MGKSAQDVLRQIKDEGIELIDLKFTDIREMAAFNCHFRHD